MTETKTKRSWPRILLPPAVIAVGVLISWAIVASRDEIVSQPPPPSTPLVRVMTVSAQDVRLDVSSQGTVEPRTESVLSAEVSGRVTWISGDFEPGGFFSTGEALVRLDPRDYELAVVRAEASVARAQLRVATEEGEARVAAEEWRTLGEGEPDPLVLHEPQLADARAEEKASRAELDRARLDLERTTVRAPYDGRVRRRDVDVGQFVTASTLLGHLDGTDHAEVRLPVPDADLAFLDLELGRPNGGTPAMPTVTLATDFAGRRWTWEGRVERSESEISARTRMLHLVAVVDRPYAGDGPEGRPPLQNGLFVNATIHGRTARDVVVLPRAALRGHDRVWVVDDDDRLHTRRLDVMRLDRERAVIAGGLEPGERVVVSLLEMATENMAVRTEPADSVPEPLR